MVVALRKVNRLITTEHTVGAIVQRGCDLLAEDLGFHKAWIGLFDPLENLTHLAASGFNGQNSHLEEALAEPNRLHCYRCTSAEEPFIHIRCVGEEWCGCFLSQDTSHGAFVRRLDLGSYGHGLLSGAVPPAYLEDRELISLFNEFADDFSYAVRELAKRERLVQQENILATIADHVAVTDREGRFLFLNLALHEALNLSHEEMAGKRAHQFLRPTGGAQTHLSEVLQHVLDAGLWQGELHVVAPEREPRILQATVRVLHGHDASQPSLCMVGRDVTRERAHALARTDAERRLTMAAEQAPGLLMQHLQGAHGRLEVLFVGEGIEELFELSADDLLADPRAMLRRVHPEDRERTRRLQDHALAEQCTYRDEYRVVLPQGGERWLHAEARPHPRHDGGTVWTTHVADVTKIRALHEERSALGARMEMVARAAGIGTWEMDLDTRVLNWDEQTCALYNLPPGRTTGTYEDWRRLANSEDVRAATAEFREAIKRTGPTVLRFRVPQPDGQVRWIESHSLTECDTDNRARRLVGINIDITDRVQQAERARLHEERLRRALDSLSSVGVQGVDRAGRINYWNEGSQRIYGWTAEEALGQPLVDLMIAPDKRDYVRQQIETMFRTGKGTPPEEYTLLHRDGSHRIVLASNVVLTEQSDDPVVYSFDIDLTERRQLEQQLRQVQKMEAVGQLAGGVAHDFNNLLLAITGYAEMAREMLEHPEQASDCLREIEQAAQRAATLTRQLLAFSRRQILMPETLDLNAVVENLMNMMRRTIPENIRVSFTPYVDSLPLYGDLGQLEQVLMNLCINARDAMPRGGRITISTGRRALDDDDLAHSASAQPGHYVFLRVADEGCGMPPEVMAQIFEPFFTTKDVGHGTGLGLATVYGIVRQHGGQIDVDSALGQGSTFTVYFPYGGGAVMKQTPTPGERREMCGGNETVLLAEDDAALRRLARRILERAGYTVMLAEDGLAAIRLCDEYEGEIHAALVDVVMPGEPGKVVAAHISKQRPDTRILFMSGYSADDVHDSDPEAPAAELLQKPYTTSELLTKLRSVLEP